MTNDDRGWRHLRNISTVLGLVNAIAVYVQKTVAGSTKMGDIFHDPNARIRFWATAILLSAAGLLAFLHLFVSTRDMTTDLDPGAARSRLVSLVFASGELVVAGVFVVLLLITAA